MIFSSSLSNLSNFSEVKSWMSEREYQIKYVKKRPKKETVETFYQLSTPMVSDALDKLGLPAGVYGISPMYYKCKKIVGPAITMRVIPFGSFDPSGHMGTDVINAAEAGDILVYDNGGRLDQNCWGDILAWSAIQKGIVGTIADGAVRDIDEIEEMGYPVYARGTTPTTGRGRTVQADYNCPIRVGTVQLNPGDIIMADSNGVAIVPVDNAEEVLKVALEIRDKETAMIEEIKKGISFMEVDKKSGYDKFLTKK
jgi:regulator of RNase E activity RraA